MDFLVLYNLLAKDGHSQKVPIIWYFLAMTILVWFLLGVERQKNGYSPKGKFMENKNPTSQNLTIGQINAIVENLGGEEGALRFLRGELVVQPVVILEPMLDFLVHVDRSVKPNYPSSMNKLMHPELELSGPAEYDLSQVDQWLHDYQKRGSVVGDDIYKNLEKDDNLATCLNLQDGLAIQAKGIAMFLKLFEGKAVFLWGSVVQFRTGHLHVPYLYSKNSKVGLDWHWLGYVWSYNNPALRFSK